MVKSKKRPSWDEYFMEIARQISKRATCDRKHVGAVIVRDKAILSTGYNGAPHHLPHCDEVGHEIVEGHCVRTVHAEANAIAQAAKNGVAIENGTIYITASPCYDCFKLMVNAGIERVVYGEFYASRYGASSRVLTLAKQARIDMRHIDEITKEGNESRNRKG
ncbi:cytidine/deoxycytidylate deaminase family protein [Patescibacteria group bacterium]|nr:cytidine/deoxycytidylate deaminase family protein [Patescibacteria group bacterium]